jgi:hypothetical protein
MSACFDLPCFKQASALVANGKISMRTKRIVDLIDRVAHQVPLSQNRRIRSIKPASPVGATDAIGRAQLSSLSRADPNSRDGTDLPPT